MKPVGRIIIKIVEFLACVACLIAKAVTDLEARRVSFINQKYSREWSLLNNVTWNNIGNAFTNVTYGSYAIVTLLLGISRCIDSKSRPTILEKIFLGLGILLFFAVGGLVFASIDQVPPELVDNGIILGCLSFFVAFLFLIDLGDPLGRQRASVTQTNTDSIDRNSKFRTQAVGTDTNESLIGTDRTDNANSNQNIRPAPPVKPVTRVNTETQYQPPQTQFLETDFNGEQFRTPKPVNGVPIHVPRSEPNYKVFQVPTRNSSPNESPKQPHHYNTPENRYQPENYIHHQHPSRDYVPPQEYAQNYYRDNYSPPRQYEQRRYSQRRMSPQNESPPRRRASQPNPVEYRESQPIFHPMNHETSNYHSHPPSHSQGGEMQYAQAHHPPTSREPMHHNPQHQPEFERQEDYVETHVLPTAQQPVFSKIKQSPNILNHLETEPYKKILNRAGQSPARNPNQHQQPQSSSGVYQAKQYNIQPTTSNQRQPQYQQQQQYHDNLNYEDDFSVKKHETYIPGPKVDQGKLVIRDYSKKRRQSRCDCNHDNHDDDDRNRYRGHDDEEVEEEAENPIKSGYVANVAKMWDKRTRNSTKSNRSDEFKGLSTVV